MQAEKQVPERQFKRQKLNPKLSKETGWTFALSILLASAPCQPASADTISPNITSGGKVYSEERPNREFFGSGMSGRLSEASYLRFSGEQALDDGDMSVALKKLSKAVQLDPGDPTGHLLYARAMTGKINRSLKKGEAVEAELISDCIEEWKLIWRHDADTSEQAEAKAQGRRLARIAKWMNLQSQGKLAVQEHKKLAGKDAPRLADREDRKTDEDEFLNRTDKTDRQLAGRHRPDSQDQ